MSVTLVQLAAALVESFEGIRLAAYWDKFGKVWTIGFGHTDGVTEGMTITRDEAVVFMAQDYGHLVDLVKDRPLLEAGALLSFGHNCGKGALERVLSGDILIQDEEFVTLSGERYGESSGGQTLEGLKARRKLEATLIEISRMT